ncbi:MAG: bifunctional (p)ppGpp synthetase/guanosine-3',5'-bis(diphosphate) 3'-pyrophosphohydrolase [Bacteroidales bacterium]|nr:bifunctional (p)ppGpp synthetase/guanosine-3',5'-bis(diphosphate) 3'-pyrophosphohydrolase [Bacteroidales bacterium]
MNSEQQEPYVIDEEREEREIQAKYEELVAACNAVRPLSEQERQDVFRAYALAKKAHSGTRRKSGEPYIFHPLAVALIAVQEVGLGPTAAICALLHDVVEDTEITLDELRELFGDRVAVIVDGVTKIEDVMLMQQSESKQAENYRKILLSMCNDAYVIFLKLCDRLHNMRTLGSMKDTKKLAISSETQYLYIPIAHRLGLYNIKTELEELVMKYTNPLRYNEIAARIKNAGVTEQQLKVCLTQPICNMLDASGYHYTIKTRVKSVYSCWKKMENKGVPFDEIYDLYAMRIILDVPQEHEKEECFRVYALISQKFRPHPDRFRDWITTPKNNGYESLHTTVMTPIGRWVEIQIRTERMDTIAEKGMAAHFLYKEQHPDEQIDNNPVEEWLMQIRTRLENTEKSALDLVEEFKETLYTKEIYIFTPKGETITLPTHSTVLDFAFTIHSDLGLHCIGAKVNAKVVPIGYVLHSGDQVEVLKSRRTVPTEEWVSQARTPHAKEAIKDYLREQRKGYREEGEKKFAEMARRLDVAVNASNIARLRHYMKITSDVDLYYQLAAGNVTEKDMALCFDKDQGNPRLIFLDRYKDLFDARRRKVDTPIHETFNTANGRAFLLEKDYERFETIPATCCKPVQGDQVVGIVEDDKILVHRSNCKVAMNEMARHENHIVRAKWREGETVSFLTGVSMTMIDRKGLLQDITRLISDDMDLYIRAITLEASEGVGRGIIMVYVNDLQVLNDLIEKLRSIDGVGEVKRI